MKSPLEAYTDDLAKTISVKTAELDKISNLINLFPDLKLEKSRWGKVYYFSKQVNSQVTDFESGFSCGCCPDAALHIFFYTQTQFGPVYSSPTHFYVGEKGLDRFANIELGWEDAMFEANIPKEMIDKVAQSFEENEPDT